jgi:RNA polymerase sigma factor (sigma-70 family)
MSFAQMHQSVHGIGRYFVWLYRWSWLERIHRFLERKRGASARRAQYRIAEKTAVWNIEDQHAGAVAISLQGTSEYARRITRQTSTNGRLIFETNTELSAQLWLAARLQDIAPEALVGELLMRGLEQEAFRAQAEAALTTLTPREREIAWLTAQGRTNRQIAENLVISPETVKTHVRHVLDKFNVGSKAELRLLFVDLGVRWWDG